MLCKPRLVTSTKPPQTEKEGLSAILEVFLKKQGVKAILGILLEELTQANRRNNARPIHSADQRTRVQFVFDQSTNRLT